MVYTKCTTRRRHAGDPDGVHLNDTPKTPDNVHHNNPHHVTAYQPSLSALFICRLSDVRVTVDGKAFLARLVKPFVIRGRGERNKHRDWGGGRAKEGGYGGGEGRGGGGGGGLV